MQQPDLYAATGIELIEREDDVLWMYIETEAGRVQVMAEAIRFADRLVLDGVHVDGEGLTLSRIRQVAEVIGRVEDVMEVIVQGARRT